VARGWCRGPFVWRDLGRYRPGFAFEVLAFEVLAFDGFVGDVLATGAASTIGATSIGATRRRTTITSGRAGKARGRLDDGGVAGASGIATGPASTTGAAGEGCAGASTGEALTVSAAAAGITIARNFKKRSIMSRSKER